MVELTLVDVLLALVDVVLVTFDVEDEELDAFVLLLLLLTIVEDALDVDVDDMVLVPWRH